MIETGVTLVVLVIALVMVAWSVIAGLAKRSYIVGIYDRIELANRLAIDAAAAAVAEMPAREALPFESPDPKTGRG